MFQNWSLESDAPAWFTAEHTVFIEMVLPISCISLTFVEVDGKYFKIIIISSKYCLLLSLNSLLCMLHSLSSKKRSVSMVYIFFVVRSDQNRPVYFSMHKGYTVAFRTAVKQDRNRILHATWCFLFYSQHL